MKNKIHVNKVEILLLGDIDSEKAEMIERFVHRNIDLEYTSSVCIDYKKYIKYKNKEYIIQFNDTIGQEKFISYYHMANGFFVVFDLTKESSLLSARDWIESIEDKIEEPKIIILGNKNE